MRARPTLLNANYYSKAKFRPTTTVVYVGTEVSLEWNTYSATSRPYYKNTKDVGL